MRLPTQALFRRPVDGLYLIGGICGLGGGVLTAVGVILSLPGLFLVGIIATAICECTLLVLLRQVSPAGAGAAGIALAIGVVIGAVGMTNLLVAPAYVAIGFLCWMIVAPLASMKLGRAGLLAPVPAFSLLIVSLPLLALGPTGIPPDHPIAQVIFGAYLLSWISIGIALLLGGLSTGHTRPERVTLAHTR